MFGIQAMALASKIDYLKNYEKRKKETPSPQQPAKPPRPSLEALFDHIVKSQAKQGKVPSQAAPSGPLPRNVHGLPTKQ